MKAIDVTGVETLKHYPKEPMTKQEGFLTKDQLTRLYNRQRKLIARLQASNRALLNRQDEAQIDAAEKEEEARDRAYASSRPNRQETNYNELERRMAQAIVDQAEINQLKRERLREAIAYANLTFLKEICGIPQEPEQPDLFADIPVGKGKDEWT